MINTTAICQLALLSLLVSKAAFGHSISGFSIGAPVTSVVSEFFALNSKVGQQVITDINAGTFDYTGQSASSRISPKIQCQSLALTNINLTDVASKLTDRAFEFFYKDEQRDIRLIEQLRGSYDEQIFHVAELADSQSRLGADTAQFFKQYNPVFDCTLVTVPGKDEQFNHSGADALAKQFLSQIPDYREGLQQLNVVFSPYDKIHRIALTQSLYAPDMRADEVFSQPVAKWGPLFSKADVRRSGNSLTFIGDGVICRFDATPTETGYNVRNSCQSASTSDLKTLQATHHLPVSNSAKISDYFIDWLEKQSDIKNRLIRARADITARLNAMRKQQKPVNLIL